MNSRVELVKTAVTRAVRLQGTPVVVVLIEEVNQSLSGVRFDDVKDDVVARFVQEGYHVCVGFNEHHERVMVLWGV